MNFFDIDVQTAIKLSAAADITVAILVFLYRHEHGAKSPLTLFASGQLMKGLGMVLISLRSVIPLWLSADLANAIFYVGVALEMFSFAVVSGSRFRSKALFSAVPLVGMILFVLTDLLSADRASASAGFVIISSLTLGGLYGLGGISLIGACWSSSLRKVLGLAFIALAFFFFSRAYVALVRDMTIFDHDTTQSLTFVTLLIVTIASGLGFLLVMYEEANQALRVAATTDTLTTLANRRRFNEALGDEFIRLKRSGAPLSLIMLDVDHFKRFNDRYGHLQGDECLRSVGLAIKSAAGRTSDIVARYGGEEFAVVAPETDAVGAKTIAENVRQAVEKLAIPHEGNSAAPHVTVSLGVVTRYATEFDAPGKIVELADQALYRAKEAGRNRVEVMPRQQDGIGAGHGLVRLVWNMDIAESGNARLDEEHKALYDLANQLLSQVVEGQPSQKCRMLLDRMRDLLAVHFQDEEAILASTTFPHIEHHIQCHKALMTKMLDMSARFDRGDLIVGDLFNFLACDVVARHLIDEDRKFFPYL